MAALVRTAIGSFRIEDAVAPERLSPEHWTEHLLPPLVAVGGLPRIEVSAEEARRLGFGQSIARVVDGQLEKLAAIDAAGRLVAIVVPKGPGLLGPVVNFPDRSSSESKSTPADFVKGTLA